MSGFNFGQIGDIVSQVMDSDYIDIKRDTAGTLKEIYSNIKCHVSVNSADNPDPNTIDVKPIVQSVDVHLPLYVDVRNNDYIIAKKCDTNGNVLQVYGGRCGNPDVTQGRKKITMQMQTSGDVEATPTPPEVFSVIRTSYVCEGESVRESTEIKIAKGKSVDLFAPEIDGYKFTVCNIDGVPVDDAKIAVVENDVYDVEFVYEKSDDVKSMRVLVNGLYTQDSGGLSSGWHLYNKIKVYSFSENDGGLLDVVSDDVSTVHEDSGIVMKVDVGVKIKFEPTGVFAEIKSVQRRANGMVSFTAESFEPTDEQRDAYECNWYENV